jgi:hypothetical protein
MSGESPREEKFEVPAGSAGAERACQANAVCDTVTPTLVRQRSRQQLSACLPFGQHESWEASECAMALWQSVGIKGEVAANAAAEPWRPMANINMTAMSGRFMRVKISPSVHLSKLSE